MQWVLTQLRPVWTLNWKLSLCPVKCVSPSPARCVWITVFCPFPEDTPSLATVLLHYRHSDWCLSFVHDCFPPFFLTIDVPQSSALCFCSFTLRNILPEARCAFLSPATLGHFVFYSLLGVSEPDLDSPYARPSSTWLISSCTQQGPLSVSHESWRQWWSLDPPFPISWYSRPQIPSDVFVTTWLTPVSALQLPPPPPWSRPGRDEPFVRFPPSIHASCRPWKCSNPGIPRRAHFQLWCL